MRARKVKDLRGVLSKKGFELNPKKSHHEFYYLVIDGIKHDVYTYFSHGEKEYGSNLMGQIKKQLKFDTAEQAEDFFDCPMTKEDYVKMLTKSKKI